MDGRVFLGHGIILIFITNNHPTQIILSMPQAL